MKEYKHFNTNGSTKYSGSDVPKTDATKSDFPIVGIGASAGGLEALVSFLGNVPKNSGLAFVITIKNMASTT